MFLSVVIIGAVDRTAMVDFGQFDVVVRLALAYPIYRHSEDVHLGTISKIGLLEDHILIFDVWVAMVVPLAVLQYHGQTSHFGRNFYPIFHARICLDHKKGYWSKIW
jgi:hypothetical protein